jgi:hypothetical protein
MAPTLFFPGLFDGEHSFRIGWRDGVCRFVQAEKISSVLVAIIGTNLFKATRRGFKTMNQSPEARSTHLSLSAE